MSVWFFALSSFAADHFGDVDITPITLANGDTHHGYREYRILVENRSSKYTHDITLMYPDRSYSGGNCISRLSRTVTVGPGASAMTPLWQPPLPINGNSQMRVQVDGENMGALTLPDPARHLTAAGGMGRVYGPRGMSYSYYAGAPNSPAAVLVSRGVNFDELSHALNAKSGVTNYSAQMATGPPDAGGRGGMTPTAWMPDPTVGAPHWIELDYNPQLAKGVRVYATRPLPPGTEVFLKGSSGSNLYHTNTPPSRGGRMGSVGFQFPLTTEPVKTVRLEFGTASAGNIGIDAVELVGAANSEWAINARASSEAAASYGPPPTAGPTRGLLRAELPMAEWSDSWLSYSAYDAVAVSQADLKALPPAALNALWSYVECGGNLLVFGANSMPEPWQSFPKTPIQQGNCANIGLGRCFAFREEKASALPSDTIKAMTDAVDTTARYWQSLPDENTANQTFPVVEDYRVPVRSTVFIMLLFVIAIGPVNLIVLSKMKRRTWLLWTIPAISFLTCVTVFGYSYLHEGITPDARISGVTVLDQANRRAASVGLTAFYCPLTPSRGLFFSPDTEATPLVEAWNYGSGTDRELDWSQAQHFGRGWVSARVPAHFELRKAETRRERLEIENAGDHLVVVNGLGATIQSLWLADDQSRVYTATNLPAGQRITLKPSSTHLQERLGARVFFEKCGAQGALASPMMCLQPNTYIADLDANPFLENGLGPKAQSARTKSHAVVFGTLELPGKP